MGIHIMRDRDVHMDRPEKVHVKSWSALWLLDPLARLSSARAALAKPSCGSACFHCVAVGGFERQLLILGTVQILVPEEDSSY